MSRKSEASEHLPLLAPPDNAAQLPKRVDRKTGAVLVSRLYFPTSYRTMERWPIQWTFVNGKAVAETEQIFKHAEKLLSEAPVFIGGGKQRFAA